MSCLKFFSTNLVDTATLTPSTQNANFPVTNLTDPRRSKVFRSTTASDNIILNFGSAKNVDSVIVVSNKQTGFGINSFSLQMNSTDSWGAPSFTQSVTLDTQFGIGYSIFTNQNLQYARFVLGSSGSFCELSKVFLGKLIDLGRGPNFNWTYQNKDLSIAKENRYGQRFVDVISRQKVINLQLTLLSKTQLDQMFEFYDAKSNVNPFYMVLGDDVMIGNHKRLSGMFYFNSIPIITNTNFNKYSVSFQLEEAM